MRSEEMNILKDIDKGRQMETRTDRNRKDYYTATQPYSLKEKDRF
jgi:hypothetical protein